MGKQILYISIPLIHHEWLETYAVLIAGCLLSNLDKLG